MVVFVTSILQLLESAAERPATMTKMTTPRLRMVKMLLNLELSLTPILRMTASRRVMEAAVQSGFSARKGADMGMEDLNMFCMVLFIRLSR